MFVRTLLCLYFSSVVTVLIGLALVESTPAAAAAACLPGYVWRVTRPQDLVCVTPASRTLAANENRLAPNYRNATPIAPGSTYACKPGYVWRDAFDGDAVCVPPSSRTRVHLENGQAASHTVGGILPETQQVGQHTIDLDVDASALTSAEKTFHATCGDARSFPGPMAGNVGWGQAEIGWTGDACFAFTLQRPVHFDTHLLDEAPNKTINKAILTFDEAEGPVCPLVLGYTYRCWQSGGGHPEAKPNGCVVVRVPTVDWTKKYPTGLVPYAPAHPVVKRVSGHEWDVTEPISWQTVTGALPIGANPGFGLLLAGALTTDQLTAQDNTVCVSAITNIKLHVTYTVAPAGVFVPPR